MDSLKEFLRPPMIAYANVEERWRPSDTEQQYHKAKHQFEIPYGPNDIIYRNNNRGFRCDDFEDFNQHRYRILFSGCSFTEGIGLPLEDVWSKVFHSMLCEKIGTYIPYWNIAVGGTGTDQIVRNLYCEGDLLRPQVVISYIPYLVRRERWHEDKWIISSRYNRDDRAAKKVFTNERLIQYHTEKNFAFIDLLMEKWDSIFLYSSCDYFFEFKSINLPRMYKCNSGDALLNYLDYARDGIHAGPVSHRTLAEKMFQNSWPIIRQKLNI